MKLSKPWQWLKIIDQSLTLLRVLTCIWFTHAEIIISFLSDGLCHKFKYFFFFLITPTITKVASLPQSFFRWPIHWSRDNLHTSIKGNSLNGYHKWHQHKHQRYKSITKKIDVTNLNQRIRNVVAKSETTAVQTLPASWCAPSHISFSLLPTNNKP